MFKWIKARLGDIYWWFYCLCQKRTDAYKEGKQARIDGHRFGTNPYAGLTHKNFSWDRGWIDQAMKEGENAKAPK